MPEQDPSGLDAHQPGAKLDAGKIRAALVLRGFSRALEEVAKVGTFGAKKYTPDGWRSVEDGFERYSDAMVRHQLYEWQGEEFDPDSGLLHAAHQAWNSLARLELLLLAQGEQFPTPVVSGEQVAEWGRNFEALGRTGVVVEVGPLAEEFRQAKALSNFFTNILSQPLTKDMDFQKVEPGSYQFDEGELHG